METKICFKLNGKDVALTTDPLRRLIDVLREDFDCKGVKEGCSEGECGACSILFNGKIVTSCIIPVGAADGQEIMTIEGVSATEKGKIIVESFADGGAVQCGFCIPGMVIAAYYLLSHNPNPTDDEIRLGISGNICRCTGYDLIVESIHLAAKRGGAIWKS
ncbi:MAG: (2Fe-2S)-binding protein [Spirochaetales bacterium]|nr:(2Fe-2S)-binding protein [Spirochaetales bacterium]MBR4426531.1 (2Fe-2S)-binding protein [Spirochaetales bacterium]